MTAGNQPFDIGTGGRASLRLADGASVTSPAMCIDDRYPHFRLFARNNGSAKGTLKAEVLFLNLRASSARPRPARSRPRRASGSRATR